MVFSSLKSNSYFKRLWSNNLWKFAHWFSQHNLFNCFDKHLAKLSLTYYFPGKTITSRELERVERKENGANVIIQFSSTEPQTVKASKWVSSRLRRVRLSDTKWGRATWSSKPIQLGHEIPEERIVKAPTYSINMKHFVSVFVFCLCLCGNHLSLLCQQSVVIVSECFFPNESFPRKVISRTERGAGQQMKIMLIGSLHRRISGWDTAVHWMI